MTIDGHFCFIIKCSPLLFFNVDLRSTTKPSLIFYFTTLPVMLIFPDTPISSKTCLSRPNTRQEDVSQSKHRQDVGLVSIKLITLRYFLFLVQWFDMHRNRIDCEWLNNSYVHVVTLRRSISINIYTLSSHDQDVSCLHRPVCPQTDSIIHIDTRFRQYNYNQSMWTYMYLSANYWKIIFCLSAIETTFAWGDALTAHVVVVGSAITAHRQALIVRGKN